MTETKPSLTEFLLARLSEDEAAWRQATEFRMRVDLTNADMTMTERVLADVEAKRRIVEEYLAQEADIEKRHDPDYNDDPWDVGYAGGLGRALELLAQPYAAHPEFRGEWAL